MTLNEIYLMKKEESGGAKPDAFIKEIADAAGISTTRAHIICTDNGNPSGSAAKLIAQHLGIPADELFPNRKRRIAGAVTLVAGLVLAVCVMDGSDYEIPVRMAGVGLVAFGGWIGDLFDKGGRR